VKDKQRSNLDSQNKHLREGLVLYHHHIHGASSHTQYDFFFVSLISSWKVTGRHQDEAAVSFQRRPSGKGSSSGNAGWESKQQASLRLFIIINIIVIIGQLIVEEDGCCCFLSLVGARPLMTMRVSMRVAASTSTRPMLA